MIRAVRTEVDQVFDGPKSTRIAIAGSVQGKPASVHLWEKRVKKQRKSRGDDDEIEEHGALWTMWLWVRLFMMLAVANFTTVIMVLLAVSPQVLKRVPVSQRRTSMLT